jgi:hypothetical protein
MTDDDELYAITYPLQERLWKAIYAKDNAQAVPTGEQSAPQKR